MLAKFKNLPLKSQLIWGAIFLLSAIIVVIILGNILGWLFSEIFDVDVSQQVFRIVVLLGIEALASLYFISFKTVKKHIRQYGQQNPGNASGMEIMQRFQGSIVAFLMLWFAYLIYVNVQEIMALVG